MEEMRPGWYVDPSRRHEGRYWDGTSWTVAVLDDGIQGVDSSTAASSSAADGSEASAAGRATSSRWGTSPRSRWSVVLAIVGVLVVGFGALVLFHAVGGGSSSDGPGASALNACSVAVKVANEYGAGKRSAGSAGRSLAGAEKSLRAAAQHFPAYQAIVQSVTAVRHDIAAGVAQPSPVELANLNAVCGRVP
jgi:hypothetical protein